MDAQSKDMDGQFVSGSLVDPLDFLEKYLNLVDGHRSPVQPFDFSDAAVDNEAIWAEEANKICPGILEFFDTHNAGSQSEGESRRPDLTAFLLSQKKGDKGIDRLNQTVRTELIKGKFKELFRWAALVIERKLATQDGWLDGLMGSETKDTKVSKRVRGQLICYNLHLFREQPRLFAFQLLLIKRDARILRWDRAGAVVTSTFDWTEGTLLSEFLTRFAAATPEQRGLDTTVRAATKKEGDKLVAECMKEDLPAPREPFWVYTVVDEPDSSSVGDGSMPVVAAAAEHSGPAPSLEHDSAPARASRGKPRYFVVGRPIANARAFTGRTSTGFVAYDKLDKQLAYLKDAWYSDDPDLLPEGQTYRRLQPAKGEKGCEFIPTLVCAGDVYNDNGDRQVTLSQLQVPEHLRANSRIRLHTHTRTVVREVGVPMTAFEKVSDLLQLMRDSIEAHEFATGRNILHRDISPGNIMINRKKPSARALLVDWDLARDLLKPQTSVERFVTGTWQFLSIVLLQHNANHHHDAEDDLESIFWLMCFCLVRYTNLHPGNDALAQDFLRSIFDHSRKTAVVEDQTTTEQRQGGSEKAMLLKKLRRGNSQDMQPRGLVTALADLLDDVPRRLIVHGDLRELEYTIAGKEREPSLDARAKKRLDEDKAELVTLRAQIATEPFNYSWLKKLFDKAIKEMKEFEASLTTASPPPGSVRVPDRLGKAKDKAEESEGQVDEDVEERSEKRTEHGSSKRGSTRSSTDEPDFKMQRSATPGRTRSGRSTVSGSMRSELRTIPDNSPMKAKKSA